MAQSFSIRYFPSVKCIIVAFLIVVTVSSDCEFIDRSVNYVMNGDFQLPRLGSSRWMQFNNSINGWRANRIQIGVGNVYNSRWGNNAQVIQLDVFQNQFYNQTIYFNESIDLYFQISYAARASRNLNSSGMVIWWNGQPIRSFDTSLDYAIHTQNFTLTSLVGNNQLWLQGAGVSEGGGITCDNKMIYQLVNANRQEVNSSCQCKMGYFDSFKQQVCLTCSSQSQRCLSCSSVKRLNTTEGYQFNCDECLVGYYLENKKCLYCNSSQSFYLQKDSCLYCNNSQNFYLQRCSTNGSYCFQCRYNDNRILSEFIHYSSFVILFGSLFSAKIVGLELFGVLQLAFFNLADNDQVNLYLTPLLSWRHVNGFNLFISSPQSVPQNVQAIGYKGSFISNINVMLIVTVIQFIIGGVLVKLSKSVTILRKIGRFLFQEFFVGLFLFSSFNVAFSFGLHWKYATPENDPHFIISSMGAIVGLALYLTVLILLIFAEESHFGEFKNKFKKGFVNQGYIEVSVVYRFCVGFYMATSNEEVLSTLWILAFSFIYIMYNITNLPFVDFYQNYRANLCHITQLVILFVTNYYRSMKLNVSPILKARLYTPAVIQHVLLVLCVVISAVALSYEIIKTLRQKLRQNKIRIHNQSTQSRQSFGQYRTNNITQQNQTMYVEN